MRIGGVRYGIELDTLSYILHHIVGKVRHKTNACGPIPGSDRPKSLKLVVVAFPLGAHDYGNSSTTSWPASIRIIEWLSTG